LKLTETDSRYRRRVSSGQDHAQTRTADHEVASCPEQEAFKAAFKSTWKGSGQTEMLVPVRE